MGTPCEFVIHVSQQKIVDLNERLTLTKLPDELTGTDWAYGTPLSEVKRFLKYWRNEFKWRDAEKQMNSLPNYMTAVNVDGFGDIEIHFVHQKSALMTAIPLIFVHGWPGSFLEVKKLLSLLTDSEKEGGPAFHVVAPSLPNFGFSAGITAPGFGLKQYAETCHKLMLQLGYEQYVSQGGDWGTNITRIMGKLYSSSLKASHLNLVPSAPPSLSSPFAYAAFLFRYAFNLYSPAERAGLERTQEFQKHGMGYFQIQTSKPQTIGYFMADSPIGLLAWIYEKLHDWTDNYQWTEEEVCTWVSLYWFSTAGPAASTRIYHEAQKGDFRAVAGGYVPGVKLGLAYFPKEIVRLPSAWATSLGEVIFVHENSQGGHFAAWENPESIVGDLRAMFGKGGKAYHIIDRASGYN